MQTVPEDSKAETAPTPREIGDTTRNTTTLSKIWTLDECLRYALENNIQLRQSRNDYLSGIEDTKEAKAAMLPFADRLDDAGIHQLPSTNVSDRNTYTGTYGIDAGLTLYEGGKLRTTVKQQQLQNRIDELSVAESENDIRIAIVQAYLQALYALPKPWPWLPIRPKSPRHSAIVPRSCGKRDRSAGSISHNSKANWRATATRSP